MTEKKRKQRKIIALICIALIIIFSIQNAELTEVKFLFWKISIYRILVILGSFGIGILVGVILMKKGLLKNNKKQ